jgi:hypothetical protein
MFFLLLCTGHIYPLIVLLNPVFLKRKTHLFPAISLLAWGIKMERNPSASPIKRVWFGLPLPSVCCICVVSRKQVKRKNVKKPRS